MSDYEQLKAAIDAKMSTNPQIRHILKLLENGKATFNDSAKYTQILSHLLGHELASQILELSDREGTTTQLLRGAYDEVNGLCSQVQRSLDKKAGIGLNPKQAPFPAERVEQYAHSLVDPTVEDNVIKRRAGAGSETITKSYHDDFIETNAEFREDAGMKCYIIRMGTDCCQWCSDVAGKYEMKDQPQGIFRRHDNCDCTIIYDGQVLRGQTGAEGKRGKKWVEIPKNSGSVPKKMSILEARELENEKIHKNSIDNSSQSGIIEPKKQISSIEFAVPKGLTESHQFRSKFDEMTGDPKLRRDYYQAAKEMLHHRSGTNGEDLYFYNTRTGKWTKSTTGTLEGTPEYTPEIIEEIKLSNNGEIVAFHNHPMGMPPSASDFNAAFDNGYKVGYTIGHNGRIFEYNAPKVKISESSYNIYIAKYKKMNYNDYNAQLKALEELKGIYGLEFREVK